jgi:hypothetical protein
MEPIVTIVTAGKYEFQIIDNTIIFRDEIYYRNFKIGGEINDCVNISIKYQNNIPIYASIPYAMYDSDCALNVSLEQGPGTILMIKTLLQHIKKELPTINVIHFEDKSNIECANNEEKNKKSKTIKKGTHVFPIPLYFFSIAFNRVTWYEKHFSARQSEPIKHEKYREKIDLLLNSEEYKSNISFENFYKALTIPVKIIEELETYYNNAKTIGKFFQSIPKNDRCRLTRDWIQSFMQKELKNFFSNIDWVIPLPVIESVSGGKRKTQKYYSPKGKISYCYTQKNIGVNPEDI